MEGIGHTANLAGVVTGHGIVLLKVPFKIQVNSSTKYWSKWKSRRTFPNLLHLYMNSCQWTPTLGRRVASTTTVLRGHLHQSHQSHRKCGPATVVTLVIHKSCPLLSGTTVIPLERRILHEHNLSTHANTHKYTHTHTHTHTHNTSLSLSLSPHRSWLSLFMAYQRTTGHVIRSKGLFWDRPDNRPQISSRGGQWS